jgi:hypothetical protein
MDAMLSLLSLAPNRRHVETRRSFICAGNKIRGRRVHLMKGRTSMLKIRIVQCSIIYLLSAGLTHAAISQSQQSGGTGPLMNDRPLDSQSQPPATNTGQELSKLIGAGLSIMQEVAKYKWDNNAPIKDPDREQKLLDTVGK